MKKNFQFALVTAVACVLTACGSKSQQSPEEQKAAEELAAKGAVFEGKNYTVTYPDFLKETYKNDITINAEGDDVHFDATFSDYPCKPADFEQYYKNFTGVSMRSEWIFDAPVIDGNIMTFKGVYAEIEEVNFVVFLDASAGVAGKLKFPVAKASEMEPKVMPILKTIKKK